MGCYPLHSHSGFLIGAAEAHALPETPRLTWKCHKPIWTLQWPLSDDKLCALQDLVKEQLDKGHIVESTSPWNSPVFVLPKPGTGRWRLLQDLRKINKVVEDTGSLQPGLPSPSMLPRDWSLAIIDIKDCFFSILLHPNDAEKFAFSVPSLNKEAPFKRYHWRFLPQGLKSLRLYASGMLLTYCYQFKNYFHVLSSTSIWTIF